MYMITVKMPWVAMTEVAGGKVSRNYHHANHASVNRIYEGSTRAINCLLLDIKNNYFTVSSSKNTISVFIRAMKFLPLE